MSDEKLLNPKTDEKLAPYILLLKRASDGDLDELECPDCDQRMVSVWFTHPAEGFYRTWFVCNSCSFHSRAQNTGKPTHFTDARCRADLERRDAEIIETAIFKRSDR